MRTRSVPSALFAATVLTLGLASIGCESTLPSNAAGAVSAGAPAPEKSADPEALAGPDALKTTKPTP